MNKIHHKGMTPERWKEYSKERQILMIGSEFARAKSFISKKLFQETRNCYERAFELLDLCTYDRKWHRPSVLRELLRFREYLGILYLQDEADYKENLIMYKALLQWSRETSAVEV